MPLWLVTSPCFLVKISQILIKTNRIFPGKGRGDKDFILTGLDSSLAEVFPHCCLFFSILVIFTRKRWVKVEQKVLNWGPSLFHKYLNPSKNFQTVFLLARVLPLVWISAIMDYIGGVRAQKTSQKWLFRGCWIGT